MGNNEKHWALGVLTTCVLNGREEGEQDPECAQLREGGKVMGGHSLAEFRWLSCRLLPRGATCIFRMTLKHIWLLSSTRMDLDPVALSPPWQMGLGMVSTFITFSQKL